MSPYKFPRIRIHTPEKGAASAPLCKPTWNRVNSLNTAMKPYLSRYSPILGSSSPTPMASLADTSLSAAASTLPLADAALFSAAPVLIFCYASYYSSRAPVSLKLSRQDSPSWRRGGRPAWGPKLWLRHASHHFHQHGYAQGWA